MQFKVENYCPLLKKKCIEHKCAWFTHIRGLNPNTGAEVDEWACAVAWMPLMSIEIAQKENQTGAAVESFRNEVVKANQQNQQLYLDSMEKMEKGIIPANVTPLNPVINLLEPEDSNKNEDSFSEDENSHEDVEPS
jgi:hypothetical protein